MQNKRLNKETKEMISNRQKRIVGCTENLINVLKISFKMQKYKTSRKKACVYYTLKYKPLLKYSIARDQLKFCI